MIYTEMTPNPNALKFVTGQTLLATGSKDYPSREEAQASPLAQALFELAGVTGVFIAQDFITVSKDEGTPWEQLTPSITQTIEHAIAAGKILAEGTSTGPSSTTSGDIENKIRAILDNEIRPAVAMDGGDVVFYGYENGIVKLHLQGACSSCPSSIMTLKAGVENRLRMEVPEIKEVIQV